MLEFLGAYWEILTIPFVGGFVGWFTNEVAIWMMFHPTEFWGIRPFLGWQGIVPANAERLARVSTRIITTKLLSLKELFSSFSANQMRDHLVRDAPGVSSVEADATSVRFAELTPGITRPHIAGNLPYSISSPLLLALLAQRAEIGPATIMLQREVAARIAAPPGSKTYGSLSVLFALYAEVETLFDVGPGAFTPAPSIWSRVLRVRWRAEPSADVGDFDHFERVLRAAFNQRRKTLRNALSAQFPRDRVEAAGAQAGVALERRAETLDVREFAALAAALTPDPA